MVLQFLGPALGIGGALWGSRRGGGGGGDPNDPYGGYEWLWNRLGGRPGSTEGTDELGYYPRLPDGAIGAEAQYQANRKVAQRNAQLMRDALGTLRSGLMNLQSYRPGGVSAMLSPYYSQMAQTLAASRTEAPDLMYWTREDAARKARNEMRKASYLSLGTSLLGAGLQAATSAATGGAAPAAGQPQQQPQSAGDTGAGQPGTEAAMGMQPAVQGPNPYAFRTGVNLSGEGGGGLYRTPTEPTPPSGGGSMGDTSVPQGGGGAGGAGAGPQAMGGVGMGGFGAALHGPNSGEAEMHGLQHDAMLGLPPGSDQAMVESFMPEIHEDGFWQREIMDLNLIARV